MEGGESAIVSSSGMAAIYNSILASVKAGDHIIADQTLYGETVEIFTDIMALYGVETTAVDCTDMEAVKAAFRPNTKLIYAETIANPMMTVVDVQGLADFAHQHGARLIIDNTFMTAVGFKPLEYGADTVVISLTKFANGHSDAVCGALISNQSFIDKAYKFQVLIGSQADPL